MDDPQKGLSGPVGDDSQSIPKSPHGSVTSRHSSTPRTSRRSSHASQKTGKHKKRVLCKNHCSTLLSCVIVGVLITIGSIAMTVCGYLAMSIASETVESVNATDKSETVLNEQLHGNLYKFRTFGPVLIGFGGFLIMCACVLICEAKDKKNKQRSNVNENLLSDHDRIMEEARERFYNENRTALMLQAHTVDYRTPKTSANESTTCLDSEILGNSTKTRVKPLAITAPESDNVSLTPESPVVLVHGPTIIEPAEYVSENETGCSIEKETKGRNDSSSNSKQSSPERKFGSPSRNLIKNNTVRPASFENSESFPVPIFPVLPKIDSPRSTEGSTRAGGAIPKSILVTPTKLSPIRSLNGPIRVRLDDSPTELSPSISPSSISKSIDCLPYPRSPGSTPAKLRRGKKKKVAVGLDASGLSQCRCRSDPSMTSMCNQDRQVDACCCLQSDCCWGKNCQLEKSMPSSSTNANKNSDDPVATLVPTGDKINFSSQLPMENIKANEQSIDVKPKISEIIDIIDPADQGLDQHHTTQQDDNLSSQNTEILTNKDTDIATTSPSRQMNHANDCSTDGGDNGTSGGSNTGTLVGRDRNSNITVSSLRQDTPGKSVTYGQTQGGVMV